MICSCWLRKYFPLVSFALFSLSPSGVGAAGQETRVSNYAFMRVSALRGQLEDIELALPRRLNSQKDFDARWPEINAPLKSLIQIAENPETDLSAANAALRTFWSTVLMLRQRLDPSVGQSQLRQWDEKALYTGRLLDVRKKLEHYSPVMFSLRDLEESLANTGHDGRVDKDGSDLEEQFDRGSYHNEAEDSLGRVQLMDREGTYGHVDELQEATRLQQEAAGHIARLKESTEATEYVRRLRALREFCWNVGNPVPQVNIIAEVGSDLRKRRLDEGTRVHGYAVLTQIAEDAWHKDVKALVAQNIIEDDRNFSKENLSWVIKLLNRVIESTVENERLEVRSAIADNLQAKYQELNAKNTKKARLIEQVKRRFVEREPYQQFLDLHVEVKGKLLPALYDAKSRRDRAIALNKLRRFAKDKEAPIQLGILHGIYAKEESDAEYTFDINPDLMAMDYEAILHIVRESADEMVKQEGIFVVMEHLKRQAGFLPWQNIGPIGALLARAVQSSANPNHMTSVQDSLMEQRNETEAKSYLSAKIAFRILYAVFKEAGRSKLKARILSVVPIPAFAVTWGLK